MVVVSNSSSNSGGCGCRKTDFYLCTVKPFISGHSKRRQSGVSSLIIA